MIIGVDRVAKMIRRGLKVEAGRLSVEPTNHKAKTKNKFNMLTIPNKVLPIKWR